ncbi:Slp family lipoprotein [Vibrio kasasachensis]|uniref:Slp family lipoprotein n=1 Tax=Vibrio kasasachensis TaxID=2910248 RepID=UPI003D0FCBBE
MISLRFIKRAICVLALFALTACTSIPEQLASDNPNIVTDYLVWQQQLDNPVDVRMGGVIANVKNLEDRTRIEVVNLPINSVGKPDINQEPNGRFVAYINGFQDPVAFSEGRLITLLGQSTGSEVSPVGEYEYDFPVMAVKGFRLWRIEERVIINETGSYLYPCRGIYCRDIHYSTRQGRVIQDVK